MKPEDFRLGMIVEVIHADEESDFTIGEHLLLKGVVYHKGKYFVLTQAWTDGKVGLNIGMECVEPVKSDLEKLNDSIKKEIGS